MLILAVALTTLCAATAFSADGDGGAQFGLMFGPSVPDAENTHEYLLTGIKGSTTILPNFTAGGYYLVSNGGSQAAADGFRYSIHGVQAAYAMPSGSGETHFGVRVGITKVRITPDPTSRDEIVFSPYHYGIFTGHDYQLMSWVKAGFEGSYLHVETGRTTQGSNVYTRNSFSLINFLVTLQFTL